MKHILLFVFLLPLFAEAQVITTFAGNGVGGFSGDNGPATSAKFDGPTFARFDIAGNLYISDWGNSRIRVVSTSGIVSTFAGGFSLAYDSGDGGQATAAGIGSPNSVATDNAGNVYIATDNHDAIAGPWLRMVNSAGVISTISGGVYGVSGDGGPATAAGYLSISDIVIDAAGNIYIADQYAGTVRKIDVSGVISIFAGGGSSTGEGVPATSAVLSGPQGLAIDDSGNVYIADGADHRIKKVSAGGLITTIAGNGTPGNSGDGGPATAAELISPRGLAVDNSGNVFVSDDAGNRVRKIDASGIITAVAGTGTAGYSGDGGNPTLAALNGPTGVSVDTAGNIYIVDGNNSVVRKVCPTCIDAAVQEVDRAEVFNVWPSPNNGTFNIYVREPHSVPVYITITDVLGQIVKTEAGIANNPISLRIDTCPGIYFVNVVTSYRKEQAEVIVR